MLNCLSNIFTVMRQGLSVAPWLGSIEQTSMSSQGSVDERDTGAALLHSSCKVVFYFPRDTFGFVAQHQSWRLHLTTWSDVVVVVRI